MTSGDCLQRFLAASAQPGIAVIEGAWHADWASLRADMTQNQDEVERVIGLAETLFGTVQHRRRQRRVRANAERLGHGLQVLDVVFGVLRRVKNKNDAWRIMEELSGLELGAAGMRRAAARKVRAAAPKPEPVPGVVYTRSTAGQWAMRLVADAGLVADIKAHVKDVEDARALFTGEGGAERAHVTTNVVLNLEDFGDLVSGGEGEDIAVQLTNGAVISGAELVTRALADAGYVGVFDPVAGPVNLYRDSRLASWKQRRLATMEHPVCAWPQCLAGADECQVHHIRPWFSGGPTNQDNLATLCPHHNGANEDGVDNPKKRGRLARVRGKTVWVPPERPPDRPAAGAAAVRA
ncbi:MULTISPECIES: HNH endonuclease signature motif containing protein [unclassified Corynebacterium]|uniref:HNH endonuclease signature motif containing protein n=1 Tax=unclassified Corynebacterium TaxID=2624378 RepID=UPI0034CDBD70